MGKLSKAELKLQKEVRSMLDRSTPWTEEECEYIYTNYDPAMDDNVTERGVFFTPVDLTMDTALFAHRHGHIVDCSDPRPMQRKNGSRNRTNRENELH